MTSRPTEPVRSDHPGPSLVRDLFFAARYYLLSRTGLLAIGAVTIGAGTALNWSWLVATGIGPLLITLLPCAIMCGLGLCAHRLVGGSCAQEQRQPSAGSAQAETSKAQLDLFEPTAPVPTPINGPDETRHSASAGAQSPDERRPTHA